MKQILYTVLILSLLAGCSNTPEPRRGPLEKTFYSITQAHQDTSILKGAVSSIDYYNLRKPDSPTRALTGNGQKVYLHETITYAADGRRLREQNHGYETDIFYYYDNSKNLYLKRYRNKNGYEESERFWYDEYNNPVKGLKYSISPGEKPYFDSYEEMLYTYYEKPVERVYTRLETFTIGYDTLRWEKREKFDVATFNLRGQPMLMNSWNYHYSNEGVKLSRSNKSDDLKSNLMNWFGYEDNKLIKIEEDQWYGSNVTRKEFFYNTYGDLVLEKAENSTYEYAYEYQYDEQGNWVQKKKFYVTDEEKKMLELEVRKITYFADGETEQGIDESLLAVEEEILYMAENVVRWADEKQQRLDTYQEAIESGEYGRQVTLESAADIRDFTPLLWEVIGEAEGDLDGDGIPDKVIVYKTPVPRGTWDTSCCLVIYRGRMDGWELWDQSFAPVLSPEVGGMVTNTFDQVFIHDKCISVTHQGLRWNCTNTYQYIHDAWRVIYAEEYGGNACTGGGYKYDVWAGIYISSWFIEDCEGKGIEEVSETKEYRVTLDSLPLMEEGVPGERRIIGTAEDGEEKELTY